MTTIAFDGNVLASDACWADNEIQIIQRSKIMRLPSGALYGGAGGFDDREIVSLLSKVKKPSQLPSLDALTKIRQTLRALLVLPSGRAFMLDTHKTNPPPDNEECGCVELDVPCAIGSGGKFARAAMEAGANAYEAVKVACKLDINSRTPIYRMTLNPKVTHSRLRSPHPGRSHD